MSHINPEGEAMGTIVNPFSGKPDNPVLPPAGLITASSRFLLLPVLTEKIGLQNPEEHELWLTPICFNTRVWVAVCIATGIEELQAIFGGLSFVTDPLTNHVIALPFATLMQGLLTPQAWAIGIPQITEAAQGIDGATLRGIMNDGEPKNYRFMVEPTMYELAKQLSTSFERKH